MSEVGATAGARPAGPGPDAAPFPSAALPAAIARLRTAPFFDGAWYLRRYRDVAMLGLDPAEHYLRYGARIGRSPGPLFDGPRYLREYPDVRRTGANPLLHYLDHGRNEGRIARRLERVRVGDPIDHLRRLADTGLQGDPQRMFASFDFDAEDEFLDCIEGVRALDDAAPLATIVMPTYNRGPLIGRAIESVLAQAHDAWELLIVDDGSSDDTFDVIGRYDDPRIRLFRQDHRGVSAARNVGLANARGEWIFYLDSDNRWSPHFLSAMLAYLAVSGRTCAYSGIAVEDAGGKLSGFRGEPFDWHACLKGNYVDLNAFGHAKSLFDRFGGFDERLRRMVDWDLILRYSAHAQPAYAPFVGCYYRDSGVDASRISVSQPIAFRAIVQAKHRLQDPSPERIAAALQLRFAIKIPAPYEKRKEWGDFHFAESLKASLERLGHTVAIDFLGQWYDRPVAQDHVVVVLRGLTAYEPRPGQVNVLWNISHPDQVGYDEYAAYDLVCVAGLSYPALLERIIGKPVLPLLQCTDTGRFGLRSDDGPGRGLLFVGNSRNEYRRIVRWAVEAGADLEVHGTRWQQFIDTRYIAGEHIDNTALAEHYAGASAVLNDHWDSMRDFGFVSNRIFDVLACGGSVISDALPSISRVFGSGVTQVATGDALAAAVKAAGEDRTAPEARRALAQHVAELHSFDARARTICNRVLEYLGLPAAHQAAPAVPDGGRIRVALLMQRGRRGPTSSGYIRLLAPLTTDVAGTHVEIVEAQGVDDRVLDACDACIVQRVAVPGLEAASHLVRRLRATGTELFVDTDDAFALLGAAHPEQEVYRGKDAALRHLMQAAREVWFSTERLRDAYPEAAAHAAIVPNMLDPRLWRNYRKPRRPLADGGPLGLLYMGTATHDGDFALLLPSLDRLHAEHPGRFGLTVIGALRQPPQRPWLRMLAPPRQQDDYPRFVRWLAQQGPFDVGLAPLADTPFNACKSDIKFLDYSALGILSMVSDVPAYAGLRERGLAVSVRNSDEAWYASLEAALLKTGDFEPMAARAADYVWNERSAAVSQLVPRLLNAMPRRTPCPADLRDAIGGNEPRTAGP